MRRAFCLRHPRPDMAAPSMALPLPSSRPAYQSRSGVRAMTDNRGKRQDWNELSRQNEKLRQENERLRYILRSICRTMAEYNSECEKFAEEPPEKPS